MSKKIIKFCFVLGLTVLWCGMALADEGKRGNDGQDPTDPLTRFDIRVLQTEGITIPGQKDAYNTTILARIDKPMIIKGAGGWVFYYRTDLPLSFTDVPSRDNPGRSDKFGFGDWFHQLIFIAPAGKKYPLGIDTFGIGGQLIMDTASEDHFGSGRWVASPLLAWRWKPTSFINVIPVFKYKRSFSGNGLRPEVNRFEFKPLINVKLPENWFITFWDSTDWAWQLDNASRFKHDWHIPLDVMVGFRSQKCLITKACVYSVNIMPTVIDDFDRNQYQAQFRVGFFF